MKNQRNDSRFFRLALATVATVALVFLAGCATTTAPRWPAMTHSSVSLQMAEVGTVAALPPEITVSQLTAGGVSEVRDDWTTASLANAKAVLETLRPEQIVYLDDLESRPELAAEIREVRELFKLIDANTMVFGLSIVAVPTRRFDFSVGGIDRILEATGGDALLVIGGKDEIFTADRKVLAVVSVLASAALTGQAVAPGSGTAHLSAGLIARDGTILWWSFVGDGGISDVRTPEGMRKTLQTLLSQMPQPTGPRKSVDAVAPEASDT